MQQKILLNEQDFLFINNRFLILIVVINLYLSAKYTYSVVYDRKDTNFWKQFTTSLIGLFLRLPLFMTAKIQIFESNSQPYLRVVVI